MRRCEAPAWPMDGRPWGTPDAALQGEPAETGPAALTRALRGVLSENRAGGAVPTGMELAAAVLWSRFLRFDVADPRWADRDRFVLSSGRFQPLLRALLRLTGHGQVPPGCAFGWHPAVETAAGPPGQGFATAVGMALAERALAGRFGRTLVDHRTWVLACESDLAAGVALEAAALAGRSELGKLVVLSGAVPGCDGGRTGSGAGPGSDAITRFVASGWAVRRVDAGDPEAIAAALAGAMRVRRPTLVACHGGPAEDDCAVDPAALAAWLASWLACGRRGAGTRRGWLRRLARHRQRAEFERGCGGDPSPGWQQGWELEWRREAPRDPSTQGAGRHGLALLRGLLPELATLHSTAGAALLAEPPGPRDWPCGVQEHGMAALANGLSLHGGLRPVLAAAFVSIDRMRPALRLGALMGQPVIYLLAGDGPGIGDGAGLQPVEQLASLRAMPEVRVFRPADAAEVEACWTLALAHDRAPSLIALSPHCEAACPVLVPAEAERRAAARAGCARGGYMLAAAGAAPGGTLIATGPEVAVALRARAALGSAGIPVAVVSLPCWELFADQPASYREDILGTAPRIGIEAASGFGWERWLGADGVFIGMDGFGPAAPADTPHPRSGITPELVAGRVRRHLGLGSGPGSGPGLGAWARPTGALTGGAP